MSRTYAGIISKKYNGNRLHAEKNAAEKLAGILQIKNYQDNNMNFVLKNWAVFLLCHQKELVQNSRLKKALKHLFILKAAGSEEAYIAALQKNRELQKQVESLVKDYAIDLTL